MSTGDDLISLPVLKLHAGDPSLTCTAWKELAEHVAESLQKGTRVVVTGRLRLSRWETEGADADSLSLPDHQDDLIEKVAAANPHTVVVLETGNPVSMPWADQVSASVRFSGRTDAGCSSLTHVSTVCP